MFEFGISAVKNFILIFHAATFLEFQTQLQREILRLEFERKNPDLETNLITEGQFAELLLTYADYNAKKRTSVIY